MRDIPLYIDAANVLLGRKVKVHRNLHKGCWSISEKGRVIAHARRLSMSGVEFVVSRKNVRAFARGTVALFPLAWKEDQWVPASYNPYRAPTFMSLNGPIDTAKDAIFCSNGTLRVIE